MAAQVTSIIMGTLMNLFKLAELGDTFMIKSSGMSVIASINFLAGLYISSSSSVRRACFDSAAKDAYDGTF